jgi:glutamate dehydrogenase/leucine dehydrogenase
MAWFVDEYARITGHFEPGVVTGKPIELGGSEGRDEATGLGGAYVLDAYRVDPASLKLRRASKKGNEPKDWKVAVQGFGNVGGHIARLLHEWGYKVVAVSDATGGRYNPDGLNVSQLCTKKGCKMKDESQGTFIENKDLLELDVDVLIPAALSDQITDKNAANIQAHTILEMANAPVAKSADDILFKRGVTIIPDILANSGGVVVSYFEWVQNSSNEYWKKERVYDALKETIVGAYERVRDRASAEKHSLRVAAYEEAIHRILAAEKLRGHL